MAKEECFLNFIGSMVGYELSTYPLIQKKLRSTTRQSSQNEQEAVTTSLTSKSSSTYLLPGMIDWSRLLPKGFTSVLKTVSTSKIQ